MKFCHTYKKLRKYHNFDMWMFTILMKFSLFAVLALSKYNALLEEADTAGMVRESHSYLNRINIFNEELKSDALIEIIRTPMVTSASLHLVMGYRLWSLIIFFILISIIYYESTFQLHNTSIIPSCIIVIIIIMQVLSFDPMSFGFRIVRRRIVNGLKLFYTVFVLLSIVTGFVHIDSKCYGAYGIMEILFYNFIFWYAIVAIFHFVTKKFITAHYRGLFYGASIENFQREETFSCKLFKVIICLICLIPFLFTNRENLYQILFIISNIWIFSVILNMCFSFLESVVQGLSLHPASLADPDPVKDEKEDVNISYPSEENKVAKNENNSLEAEERSTESNEYPSLEMNRLEEIHKFFSVPHPIKKAEQNPIIWDYSSTCKIHCKAL